MKIYLLLTYNEDSENVPLMTYHRRIHFFEEQAAEEGAKMKNTMVMVFEHTRSFMPDGVEEKKDKS